MRNTNVDKNSRPYLEGRISSARYSLLLVIIFSVVNLILLLTQSDRYFLFSASVPYYLTAFGMGMDRGVGGSVFTVTALLISALILAAYVICWLQSKQHWICTLIALCLFAIDTVLLVVIVINLELLQDNILDLLFHAWAVTELTRAVIAQRKLQAMPVELEEDPVAAE